MLMVNIILYHDNILCGTLNQIYNKLLYNNMGKIKYGIMYTIILYLVCLYENTNVVLTSKFN